MEVGRTKCYNAHERIQKFLQQTALPPAGVLQSSCSVGPRLRVDFLASSDTPARLAPGPPTTRPRDAAVNATGTDGAASGAAAAAQRIRRRPQQQQQSLRLARTPAAAVAAAAAAAVAAASAAVGGGTGGNLSAPCRWTRTTLSAFAYAEHDTSGRELGQGQRGGTQAELRRRALFPVGEGADFDRGCFGSSARARGKGVAMCDG